MLTLTHTLIELRRSTPALSVGSYQPIDSVPDGCFVYLRQSGSQRYLIVLNFSSNERTLELPEIGNGRIILSTLLDREDFTNLTAFRLRNDEGCIIELTDFR